MAIVNPPLDTGFSKTGTNLAPLGSLVEDGYVANSIPLSSNINRMFKDIYAYLNYLKEVGISQWDSTISYQKNARTMRNGELYKSLSDANTGNDPAVASSTFWEIDPVGYTKTEVDTLVTPTNLLAKVKTVDGSGSGLDTDLVRGLPADFTSSKAANGYQKLPSGLIVQWGTFTGNNTANTSDNVVFPIAFPTACVLGIGNYNSTIAEEFQATVDTLTTTSMNVTHNTASLAMLWFALGY